jgi:DNA-binding NarL/FixJ family response regulator
VTRVVIADDHPLFLDGLRALLEAAPGIDVVDSAMTAAEAVDTTIASQPDVVVLDLNMPGAGGIATIREIVSRAPLARVLVLTMYDDDGLVFEAVKAGASGYVLKGAHPDEVISAVRAVAQGEAVFGAGLARRLADWFDRAAAPDPFEQLTPREREVLELLAHGVRNSAIAQRLGISLKTVRNLVSSVLTKLQVPDREAARQRAHEAGLGRRPGTLPGGGGTPQG